MSKVPTSGTVKTFCHRCLNDTKHSILYYVKQACPDFPKDDLLYYVNQCNGCEYISFLFVEIDGEDSSIDKYTYPDDHLYPIPKHHDAVLKSSEVSLLPKNISVLYKEVQKGMQSEMYLLTCIGLRALIESVCNHKKIQGRNLAEKLKYLQGTNVISSSQYAVIDKIRLIGNDSAHKIKPFKEELLVQAIKIVNHVLDAIYILPKRGKKIAIRNKKKTGISASAPSN